MSAVLQREEDIWDFDPVLGCPFDRTDLCEVEESDGLHVNQSIRFRHVGEELDGVIVCIGKNAKSWKPAWGGGDHTALLVRRGENMLYLKRVKDVIEE